MPYVNPIESIDSSAKIIIVSRFTPMITTSLHVMLTCALRTPSHINMTQHAFVV